MVGKGKRRREKNYRAAHGGESRLPPPPKLKELEALPSKLRRLMELKNNPFSTKPGLPRSVKDAGKQKEKGGNKAIPKDMHSPADSKLKMRHDDDKVMSETHIKEKDQNTGIDDIKKGKRKRKTVEDLRFQDLDQSGTQSRKKKRKEYLEAKKKKKKNDKTDNVRNFPGCEQIKFGEVVEAPPKLTFPKRIKNPLDASRERLRLQAIEEYRNRRGWMSRPGIQLPTLAEDLT
ncbi:uncharacterized protein [Typha latifolia]|uniref:uncharacterized protein n=1 Tax=Typha latifolia TaxID=4733 RepID=UPI003C2F690D